MKKGDYTKMRKFLLMFILAIFSVLVVACGGGDSDTSTETDTSENGDSKEEETTTSNEEYEFLIGSWVPATHPSVARATEPWAQEVEDATNGVVSFDLQAGGVLGASDQVITDVSGGVYDVGFAVGQFYPDTVLYKMTILDLPFALANADDHMHASRVSERYMNEVVAPEIEQQLGLKLIGSYLVDPTVFISTEPIKTIEDMKNKRTYMQAATWEKIIKEWGAVPVSMSVEDVYTALERGSLDIGVYALAGMYSQKLHEAAHYVTVLPTSNIAGAIVMNLDKYNSLPDDIKEQFEAEFSPRLTELNNSAYAEQQQDSLKAIEEELEGKGEIIYPSDDDVKDFMAPAKEVWLQWIETANEKGFDGEAIMEQFLTIMKEEGIEPPFDI